MKTKWTILALASIFVGSLFAAEFSPTLALHFSTGILVNSNDMTVYTYDPDNGSTSVCYGGCAKAWPPVLAPSSSETLPAGVGVTTRRDGSQQLTYQGHPVYLYAGDAQPGDLKGDGLGGVWHVIRQNP